jgi:hypothetical protein
MNILNWLKSLFKGDEENLSVGDIVISTENRYGFYMCRINRIYYRNHGGHLDKYCCIQFDHIGSVKVINVTYKSCHKV